MGHRCYELFFELDSLASGILGIFPVSYPGHSLPPSQTLSDAVLRASSECSECTQFSLPRTELPPLEYYSIYIKYFVGLSSIHMVDSPNMQTLSAVS